MIKQLLKLVKRQRGEDFLRALATAALLIRDHRAML